jgi:hypothetical protein
MTNTRHLLTVHTALLDQSYHGHCHFDRAQVSSEKVFRERDLTYFSLVSSGDTDRDLLEPSSSTRSIPPVAGDETITFTVRSHHKRVNIYCLE